MTCGCSFLLEQSRAKQRNPSHHKNGRPIFQSTPFVRDSVGRFAKIQTLVNLTRELIRLSPEGMTIRELTQLLGLQPLTGQFAHLFNEPQVTALRCRRRIGSLKNLDQAFYLAIRP